MTSQELICKIQNGYPKVLNLNDVSRELHISRRKVSWLLHNKYIECTIGQSQNKTKQFQVKSTALLEYLKKVEQNDTSIIIPSGIFSTKNQSENMIMARISAPEIVRLPLPDDFSDWLYNKWAKLDELLTVAKIIEITGYYKTTIQRWYQKRKLKSLTTQKGLRIAKVWLIDFIKNEGYKIQNKSEKHINLIVKYYKQKS